MILDSFTCSGWVECAFYLGDAGHVVAKILSSWMFLVWLGKVSMFFLEILAQIFSMFKFLPSLKKSQELAVTV